jgi:hypothetical protein
MKKVLLVTEQYCDADPAHGPTNTESVVAGTIQCSGLPVNLKHFYYDQLGSQMVELLLQDIEFFKPEVILYAPIGGPLGQRLNPPWRVINAIRKMGIKVFVCLWDTVNEDEEVRRILPFADLVGIWDSDASRFKIRGDDMKKILVVTEQYCDADPKCGPTNAESMIVGAIECSGLPVTLKHFYYDQLSIRLGKGEMVKLLLQDIELFQPEAIIYNPMGGGEGLRLNPPGEVINDIRKRGIKVYQHMWDTTGREEEIMQVNAAFADLVGILDQDVAQFARFQDPKVIQAWSAIDNRDFFDKRMKRDYDVCFVGGVDFEGQRWPQRAQMINYLKAQGVPVKVAGGQRTARLEWNEYAEILCRSKISLNFSKNVNTGTSQLKGRVFESIACGAMLLEDDGDQTRKFFEPGKEWVMFTSPDDMVEKAIYYLRHPAEREAIAQAGRLKLEEKYSARVMWSMIFDRLEKA